MNQYMKGVLCTIIGGACWGISGTCGEYLCTYRGMDTRVLTDMRLLGAGIILCIFLACRERKKLQEFLHTPKALIHCIIFGVCGLMFTQFAYLTAISKTNAGTATVLQYLSAIIVLLVVCVKNRKITGVAGKYSNYTACLERFWWQLMEVLRPYIYRRKDCFGACWQRWRRLSTY